MAVRGYARIFEAPLIGGTDTHQDAARRERNPLGPGVQLEGEDVHAVDGQSGTVELAAARHDRRWPDATPAPRRQEYGHAAVPIVTRGAIVISGITTLGSRVTRNSAASATSLASSQAEASPVTCATMGDRVMPGKIALTAMLSSRRSLAALHVNP